MKLKLLCIGDIVGRPGRQILSYHLPRIVSENEIDCVIVNAENAAGGSGLTPQIYHKLLKYGVHLITMGDHLYRKREIVEILQNSDCIVRPANLSPQAAGREWAVYQTARGESVAVISLLGRMYMNINADNPFHAVDRVLAKIPTDVKIIVVDVHAEATSEKVAMGWFLDGRASLVFGSHTHITTADETILPHGTAYITDLGMTGSHASVLGRSVDRVLKSLTTQMPYAYSLATDDLRINGIIVTVETSPATSIASATSIQRLCIKDDSEETKCNHPYDADDGRMAQQNNNS
ncbi:MAG: TIGR00282 family metallophosphoesterase [Sedimentisphaerales bacterium]|nr:TIGR00282 family metallophosphoesterase [Sedimentisphaerales bacterium]